MDTKERVPVSTPAPRQNRWMIAVAAFALVLVVGVAVLALTSVGESEPASPATTVSTTQAQEPTPTTQPPGFDAEAAVRTVELAAGSLVGDINAGMAGDEIVSLHLAPPLGTSVSPAQVTLAYTDEWYDHLVAIGTTYELGECRVVGDDGFAVCELRSTSPHEPFYPDHRVEEYRMRFVDGEVVFAELRYPGGEAWAFAEVAFETWLREAHPEVAASMYTVAGAGGFPAPRLDADPGLFTQNLITYVAEWRTATGSTDE